MALFLLIFTVLFVLPTIASQDDGGGPPEDTLGNPLTVYAAGALNSLRSGLTHLAGASTTTVIGALSRGATNAMSLPPLPSNGPFTAQCLASYSPMAGAIGPPAGYIYDQVEDSKVFMLPWIVAVVPELHGATCGFVDPAFYNLNGSGIERLLRFGAIKRHMLAGRIFFPEIDSPDYPTPNPGDKVTVSYADVSSFSGGKYTYVNNNPLAAPSQTRPSRGTPSRSPDLNFPSDSSDAALSALQPFVQAACDSTGAGTSPAQQRRPSNLTFGGVTLRSYQVPEGAIGRSVTLGRGQHPITDLPSRTPAEFFEFRSSSRGTMFGRIRGRATGGRRYHRGEDVYVPPRSIIYAPFDGEVIRISRVQATESGSDYGKIVVIKSSEDPNLQIRVIHLKEPGLASRGHVAAGDVIGTSFYANPSRPGGRQHIARDAFPGSDPSHIHVEAIINPGSSRDKGNVNPYSAFDISLLYWPACSEGPAQPVVS